MVREKTGRGPSRRQLLIGGGAGIGLLIAWKFWPRAYAPNLRAREGETVYNAWLKIGRDGHVTVAVPQAELGQGVYTAFPRSSPTSWARTGARSRSSRRRSPRSTPTRCSPTQAADDSGWPSGLQGTGRWLSRRYATQTP